MLKRVLFLNTWPQFRAGPRWDNELARPEDLVPAAKYQVTYVTDQAGRTGIPVGATDAHIVEDISDIDAVMRLVDGIVAADGLFQYVIAFSEHLLDTAAAIRRRHHIPGHEPEVVDRFRDKRIMKSVLAGAGVRVPAWRPWPAAEQLRSVTAEIGFPLILKPARGASSVGVHRIESFDELSAVSAVGTRADLADHELEEFVHGDVLHADGVVDHDGRCLFMSVSRYVADCLSFAGGEPFGSVLQTDPDVLARCTEFAGRCLAALDLSGSAFHLEFFDTGSELVFLEIGARVPGADVPNLVHDVFGVNLFRLWTEVVLEDRTEPPPVSTAHDGSGGWFMIPRPEPLPRRVVSATPLVGAVPYLYRELVPQPGDLLEHTGGYATLQGGRFLFRGGTQDEIHQAVTEARSRYHLTTVPATPDDRTN